ncbi:hypothetical protein D3C72_1529640 [compost metagenome]
MLLHSSEGHLNIPPASVKGCHLAHGQDLRVEDVGQVTVERGSHAELHQPHGVGCLVLAVHAQPHQRIQRLTLLVEHMTDVVGGVGSAARNPVVVVVGEVVEPGEAVVAQVSQNEALGRQVLHHLHGGVRLVLIRVSAVNDPPPLLKPHVEQGAKPPWQ